MLEYHLVTTAKDFLFFISVVCVFSMYLESTCFTGCSITESLVIIVCNMDIFVIVQCITCFTCFKSRDYLEPVCFTNVIVQYMNFRGYYQYTQLIFVIFQCITFFYCKIDMNTLRVLKLMFIISIYTEKPWMGGSDILLKIQHPVVMMQPVLNQKHSANCMLAGTLSLL